MSFSVDPQYLRTFAGELDHLSDEAPEAKTYVGRYLDIGYSDARLFATIAKACSDAKAALEANYQGLKNLAAASASEVTQAAAMYERTDDDQARALDAQYESIVD